MAASNAVIHHLQSQGEAGLVAAPTGTGKTTIFCDVASKVATYVGPVTVVTHTEVVIAQNERSMRKVNPNLLTTVYSAGLKRKEYWGKVRFAGIQSIWKKPELFADSKLLIIDEAHMIPNSEEAQYRKFLAGMDHIPLIGFSATPYRMGSGLIVGPDNIFKKMIIDLTETETFMSFVTDGYLSPLVTKAGASEIDIRGISQRMGDFDKAELESATNSEELNRAVVEEIVTHALDRKHWLVFANSIEHGKELMRLLSARGVTVAMVTGSSTPNERAQLLGSGQTLGAFQRGDVRCVVNVGVLTTGFDFPALDFIAVVRAMQSTALWVQILGRGTRVAPGKKNCLVMDFGGNTRRLGPVNDPIMPIPRKKGETGEGSVPLKICPECRTYIPISAKVCPHCQAEQPVASKVDTTAGTDLLMVTKKSNETRTVNVTSMAVEPYTSLGGRKGIIVKFSISWIDNTESGYATTKKDIISETLFTPDTASNPQMQNFFRFRMGRFFKGCSNVSAPQSETHLNALMQSKEAIFQCPTQITYKRSNANTEILSYSRTLSYE